MKVAQELLRKISSREAKVGVVGIGYVGSALGQATAAAGFLTVGFDVDQGKVNQLNRERIPRFSATSNSRVLESCDVICLCVPTPINHDKTPNLDALRSAIGDVTFHLRPGQLIVLESSVAPGTTRKICLPLFEQSGYKVGSDFFLSFSPERVDPGNEKFNLKNIPKVVAGLDEDSTALATAFYQSLVDSVVPVSSVETAETVKLLENSARLINISFVNEMAQYTQSLGVDIWEVIAAAATKPFGYLAHYPGPGVGGHCIPVDPYYLLEDAKKRGVILSILEQAGRVNDEQPGKIVQAALEILKERGEKKAYKILLVGVSYKADVADLRESPALAIWLSLTKLGHLVSYHDPLIPTINGDSSISLTPDLLAAQDLILITTAHSQIDYEALLASGKPILDTRDALGGLSGSNIYRWGTGRRTAPKEVKATERVG